MPASLAFNGYALSSGSAGNKHADQQHLFAPVVPSAEKTRRKPYPVAATPGDEGHAIDALGPAASPFVPDLVTEGLLFGER